MNAGGFKAASAWSIPPGNWNRKNARRSLCCSSSPRPSRRGRLRSLRCLRRLGLWCGRGRVLAWGWCVRAGCLLISCGLTSTPGPLCCGRPFWRLRSLRPWCWSRLQTCLWVLWDVGFWARGCIGCLAGLWYAVRFRLSVRGAWGYCLRKPCSWLWFSCRGSRVALCWCRTWRRLRGRNWGSYTSWLFKRSFGWSVSSRATILSPYHPSHHQLQWSSAHPPSQYPF